MYDGLRKPLTLGVHFIKAYAGAYAGPARAYADAVTLISLKTHSFARGLRRPTRLRCTAFC